MPPREVGYICNSYTIGCPPVRVENTRALASGLFYVQVDKHGIAIFYTTYISVDLAHHEILLLKLVRLVYIFFAQYAAVFKT